MTIQDDLFSQLFQFRTYKYVIIGDIEKMYRQFLIREKDRIYQKILWFDNGEIREYALNTVTFGVTPAPFLAIRRLHQLAEDEENKFPLASRVLKKNMYADNILTGANCKDEAREICHQMIDILQTADLKMYQWASNDNEILNVIAKRDLDVNFDFSKDNPLKTLGLYWKAKNYVFVYEIKNIKIDSKITKRKILSDIANIFDPLGFLGPILLFAKIIMQEMWQAKIEWDESVPSNIHYAWNEFSPQLNPINSIKFDRLVVTHDAQTIEIHGFRNASQKGYGACIYLKSTDFKENSKITLLCSKSRVAPLKTRTIPRLELCAMQLLASL